jgi:predicted O-methyltransferase YrrM
VEIKRGAGLDILPTLEGGEPFDFIFIVADKGNYVNYLDWALKLVRPGGIVAGDNALAGGSIADPDANNDHVNGLRAFNQRMATDPRITSVIVPLRDGVCLGVVDK